MYVLRFSGRQEISFSRCVAGVAAVSAVKFGIRVSNVQKYDAPTPIGWVSFSRLLTPLCGTSRFDERVCERAPRTMWSWFTLHYFFLSGAFLAPIARRCSAGFVYCLSLLLASLQHGSDSSFWKSLNPIDQIWLVGAHVLLSSLPCKQVHICIQACSLWAPVLHDHIKIALGLCK